MTPSRWQQIEELYHATLECEPSQRAALLARADPELRREVESLLAQESGATPLDRPAWEGAASLLGSTLAALTPGTQLGPYKIEGPLGSGGMGEVFRATDSRLGRAVAIKTSQEQFSERFDREARAISSLNHPHICTLYDVGPNYLVMEVCEGETLVSRLKRGKLSIEDTLRFGQQIADALAAAHAKGIVHRDLKPGNIMLSKAGIKVLDFGLAKSPQDLMLTDPRMVMGTPAYMAPEQREGKECDARTDIYSLGLVLNEMATGKRVEQGQTPLLDRLPERLTHVIERCLEQDPAERWQTASDVRKELQWAATSTAILEGAPASGGSRRLWLAWSVAAVAIVGLAPGAFLYFREKPPLATTPVHFQIPVPKNATASSLALSPDGRKLAFNAAGRLWVHSLESGESRDLTAAPSEIPFWSPDSRFIGFPSEGKLKKIEATGGPPQTVADLPGNLWSLGAWGQDDVIVFGDRRMGLFRVPASGGVPVQITALDTARHEITHYVPSFLPDGRHFVYIRTSRDEGKSAIYLGSVDTKPEQQSSQPLMANNWAALYAPSADPSTGYLLFVRESTLMAQPFDNRRLELKGQAEPLAEQIGSSGIAYAPFSASANDVLVFQQLAPLQLAWFDQQGKILAALGESVYGQLALSPDGTWVAMTNPTRPGTTNIWLQDLFRSGASTRFTFGSSSNENPVWSPDGSRIIFSSNRDGPYNLYQKPAKGGKDEEILLKSSEDKRATSWSRDGRFLLYQADHPKTQSDLWVLPLEGHREPVPFLITEFNERQARFSPDGHWVAYCSNESGHDEIYVRSFSMNSAGTAVAAGGKWQVSDGFGQAPHWRGDGRELFYRSRGGELMTVEIATDPAFRTANPKTLLNLTLRTSNPVADSNWDSAADGKRFLGFAAPSGPQPFTVVLNWQSGLKK